MRSPMAVRSSSRKKISFEILSRSSCFEDDASMSILRSSSDPIFGNGVAESRRENGKRRRHKGSKKKKGKVTNVDAIPDNGDYRHVVANSTVGDSNCVSTGFGNFEVSGERTLFEDRMSYFGGGRGSGGSVTTLLDEETVYQNGFNFGELRHRNVTSSACGSNDERMSESKTSDKKIRREESGGELRSSEDPRFQEEQPQPTPPPISEPNGNVMTRLETAGSLDWRQLMADDPDYISAEKKSPMKYFMEEISGGNSLRSTTSPGNEKERERVYDAIFRLPWRCEVLITIGFFVCFNSFLSLLTVMPIRVLMMVWRLSKNRQFKRPSSSELSDFGCFVVLASGVTLLARIDISLIYHMIRGQSTFKLYVVYNVLEIFDKLCQSLCGDVLQALFSSAEGLASSSPEKLRFWTWRFISDQALTTAASILHSFILLAQAITLSTCIVAHNNALLALLVSNNFAEIKSNVFKRFSRDNIHCLVYADSIERFHISAFLVSVLAQNILEAEGPWFGSFLYNVSLVFLCEMLIDIIKHSFLAKFNDIKPIAYSEFLEALCQQTLNIQSRDRKTVLTFVPFAPACVVIRVLTPVYAAHIPYSQLPVKIVWILVLSGVTYVMLTSLKILIGMGLQKHATWYIDRCCKRKFHLHTD
ncbi:PREDICTED: protein POLLEN DEFECTIVE IN GUIDANCE 1-like [Tarenaya hassleriana]|uniref:protein POLLEN DEFECTIVE IN GUIDANCE 1-like n=1 Tax=Tarenaya hassleriana TaxID=28532 RepID=UPI00053C6904|nr:PREDICTED: protein POLLEN DEFECTIVE IN GUIDANCE 1-like [Tarenaya hassleriana]